MRRPRRIEKRAASAPDAPDASGAFFFSLFLSLFFLFFNLLRMAKIMLTDVSNNADADKDDWLEAHTVARSLATSIALATVHM